MSNYRIHNGEASGNFHVVVTLDQGWNLLPLDFIAESSGRYWSNYDIRDTTCSQDIFQNVWYYSPVRKEYYHLPAIDDWIYPKTRENEILMTEFSNKYYHIYSGSGWIYTPEPCSLAGDDGTSLYSQSYGDQTQDKEYRSEELVLKAGWNFISPDFNMYTLQKNFWEMLVPCGVDKAYGWHSDTQEWENIIPEANQASDILQTTNIFETVLVKTRNDCNLLDFSNSDGSPPSLP